MLVLVKKLGTQRASTIDHPNLPTRLVNTVWWLIPVQSGNTLFWHDLVLHNYGSRFCMHYLFLSAKYMGSSQQLWMRCIPEVIQQYAGSKPVRLASLETYHGDADCYQIFILTIESTSDCSHLGAHKRKLKESETMYQWLLPSIKPPYKIPIIFWWR